jgi:Flp pilus assembly protein TadB
MRKVIVLFLAILVNFSAFAATPSAETVAMQNKLESIVNGTYQAKNAKEAKALGKFKSKFQKLTKKIKEGKKASAGDIAGLLVTIGIILIIVGLVVIILGVLGFSAGYVSGGGALVLGLILYLVGKYAL